jgi:hypothetical protein
VDRAPGARGIAALKVGLWLILAAVLSCGLPGLMSDPILTDSSRYLMLAGLFWLGYFCLTVAYLHARRAASPRAARVLMASLVGLVILSIVGWVLLVRASILMLYFL